MAWANKTSFVLVCATILFTALAYGTVHQSIIALFYIIVALIVILQVLHGLFGGYFQISGHPLQIPIAGAALYGVIQIIPFGSLAETAGISGIPRTISLEPFATQLAAIHFVALLLFFTSLLALIDSESRIKKLVAVITIFGFAFGFFSILQSVLSPDKIYGIYESRYASPFGSFVNRHNYAAYILMATSIPLGLLFTGAVGKDKRLLLITAVALMGASLMLSRSRGGLVAFLSAIIFLLILTTGNESRKKIAIKTGLAVLLFVAVIGGSIFVGGESSLTRIAETTASGDVSTGRWHIWEVTFKIIAQGFPFGTGFGAYGIAFTRFDSNSGMERVEEAHNDFLQAISDAGIVGLILGGLFLYFLFRAGFKAARSSNAFRRGVAIGAFSGCFGIVVHSFFDFVLHTTAVSVLFLALLTLIVKSGERFEGDAEEPPREKRRRRNTASIEFISDRVKKRNGEI